MKDLLEFSFSFLSSVFQLHWHAVICVCIFYSANTEHRAFWACLHLTQSFRTYSLEAVCTEVWGVLEVYSDVFWVYINSWEKLLKHDSWRDKNLELKFKNKNSLSITLIAIISRARKLEL